MTNGRDAQVDLVDGVDRVDLVDWLRKKRELFGFGGLG